MSDFKRWWWGGNDKIIIALTEVHGFNYEKSVEVHRKSKYFSESHLELYGTNLSVGYWQCISRLFYDYGIKFAVTDLDTIREVVIGKFKITPEVHSRMCELADDGHFDFLLEHTKNPVKSSHLQHKIYFAKLIKCIITYHKDAIEESTLEHYCRAYNSDVDNPYRNLIPDRPIFEEMHAQGAKVTDMINKAKANAQ